MINIGIVGGKDGPTAVYWSKNAKKPPDAELRIATAIAVTAAVMFVVHIAKSGKKRK